MTSMAHGNLFSSPFPWIRKVLALWTALACLGWSVGALAQDTTAELDSAPVAELVEQAPAESAAETTVELAEDEAGAAEDATEVPYEGIQMLAIVIALFVIPMYLGGRFAKKLRMPDHGWKIAMILGTLAAATVVVVSGKVKFGPDLSGGVTMIFEMDAEAADRKGLTDAERDQAIDDTISALTNRVDPSGTKEVTIRKYGQEQIEIIIPEVSPAEQLYIERRIYTAGALEFRITAVPVFSDHRPIIDLANALPPGESEVWVGDEKVAEWVAYRTDEFGGWDQPDERLVKRGSEKTTQALILTNDGNDVTGDDLDNVSKGVDEQGRPKVIFSFKPRGAAQFGQLTGRHIPNASGQVYFLGVVLDGQLLSAPSIQSRIRSQGEITGSMGEEEVEFIVGILKSGSLPLSLNHEPISRETISPTLGAETVAKGKTAILISLAAVMVFMLFYYRFAGLVACLALAANLLMILGLMILIKGAFTLPGLAGLVLTVGMSVDANVLIFERIREERMRGAALRMAIRNGFGRATQTIVDANLTTLITAIVIWRIAPDNVKGFGVTLILGILMSMYSAIFMSRVVFDIAERSRRLKELGMRQILKQTHLNFLNKRLATSVLSLSLIAVGLVAVYDRVRDDDLLNIDFTGGSSVTMVFKEDQTLPFAEVKAMLESSELSDQNLTLVRLGESDEPDTHYRVSCVNEDIEAVQSILQDKFGPRLKTYRIEFDAIESLPESAQANRTNRLQVTPVNFLQDQQSDASEETAPADTQAEDSAEQPADSGAAAAGATDRFAGGTSAHMRMSLGSDPQESELSDAGVTYETAVQLLEDALDSSGHPGRSFLVSNENYLTGSAQRFDQWNVKLALPEDQAREVFTQLEQTTNSRPIFPLANKIGGRVAGDMKTKAIAAVGISLLGIVAYIWFRFQSIIYGLAAVVALIHDVLLALGMIAASAYLVSSVPVLANALLLEKYQISLPIVAAFLTIIGYSLNDTIVVFDRIREVKGKSPRLTEAIVNTSINQTLSRTLLTSMTTLLTVVILYTLGGDGIHGFAFCLVIGVIVGTYSSIFVASPSLLWMSNWAERTKSNQGAAAA